MHFFLVQFSNLICLRAATMYVQIGFVIFQNFWSSNIWADFLSANLGQNVNECASLALEQERANNSVTVYIVVAQFWVGGIEIC